MGARGCCRHLLSHFKCRMLGNLLCFQHRCRHMDMEDQPRKQHSTLRGDAPPAALGTQSWWLLSTLLSRGTSLLCLSHTNLAWQKQQFCQPSSSKQGRSNQEDDITAGKKKPTKKTPNQKKPHNNHKSTISSSHWNTTRIKQQV